MLFGVQGLVGAGFAAGWKAITFSYTGSGLTPSNSTLNNFNSQNQFYMGLVSAGMGAAFGLGAGLLILIVNKQENNEYYEDYFYWVKDDQIRYPSWAPVPVPVHVPTPVHVPVAAPVVP